MSFVLALAFLFGIKQAEAAAGGALKQEKWRPLLTFTSKVAAVPGRALKEINAHADYIKAAAQRQAQIAVYLAAKTDQTALAAYGPFLVAMAALQQHNIDAASDVNAKAIRATAAEEFVRGHIAEFFAIAGGAHGSGSAGCLSTNDENSIVNKAAAVGAAAASLLPPDVTPKADNLEEAATTGFASLTGNTGIKHDELTNDANCKLFSQGADGLVATGTTSDTIDFAAGYLGRHKASGTGVNTNPSNFGDSRTHASGRAPAIKEAFDAITELKTIKANVRQPELTSYTELTTATELKKAIQNIILHKEGEYESGNNGDITAHITKYYKSAEQEFKSKFWGKLKEVKIPKELNNNKDETLEAVTDLSTLAAAFIFYTNKSKTELQTKISELEAKNNKAELKSIEQICNGKTDADTCRQDKNCKYDETKKEEPKCVLSKDGEKEAAKKKQQRNQEEIMGKLTPSAKEKSKKTANLRIVSGRIKGAKITVFFSIRNFLVLLQLSELSSILAF
ncbi:Trypanosome variant surface glycoprotein (A-type), putative [Trypanosoma equiperdum]|uniref:Trypanosome variant surface glycoprotein (A-type), putative n=1 Tax=Trypanosoma equiperdum TaxID=5694 RepID=A0A1G4ID86_TRYEQ|nr:Trypanosome variant surface glycoprotein (A-type), putative [Trypanosoma equiperdum]